ncbi:hypothetical protein [Pedobacter sp. HMWF019]|nr:hypothetical protein [Pedobacter sp. HMWF019]
MNGKPLLRYHAHIVAISYSFIQRGDFPARRKQEPNWKNIIKRPS